MQANFPLDYPALTLFYFMLFSPTVIPLTCLVGTRLPLHGCELLRGDLLEPGADRVLHQVRTDGRVKNVQLRTRLACCLKLLDDLPEIRDKILKYK